MKNVGRWEVTKNSKKIWRQSKLIFFIKIGSINCFKGRLLAIRVISWQMCSITSNPPRETLALTYRFPTLPRYLPILQIFKRIPKRKLFLLSNFSMKFQPNFSLTLQPNFQKGGLTGPQLLEGGYWERGVWLFSGEGGAIFTKKKKKNWNPKYLIKKVYKQKYFSLS